MGKLLLAGLLVLSMAVAAQAAIFVQCPGDIDGDAIRDPYDAMTNPYGVGSPFGRQIKCMHLSSGDGFSVMSDGKRQYTLGFADVTGVPEMRTGDTEGVIEASKLKMTWPAPTIEVDEGDEFYLTLSNVGMKIRPDLFDPHSVHWHGFPQAASIFDGLPESSFGINMLSSLTYYYNVTEPGTFMYHCHIEAVEHMQMGMLGNLWVNPVQNKLPDGTSLERSFVDADGTPVTLNWTHNDGERYVFNDGDGSTYYDVQFPIMLGGFDPAFHDASEATQPLPFADMEDTYVMINGRGYPDTTDTSVPTPGFDQTMGKVDLSEVDTAALGTGPTTARFDDETGHYLANPTENNDYIAQRMSAKVTATAGQKVLLRIINLNITHFWTLHSDIPMTIIGHDAEQLRRRSFLPGMEVAGEMENAYKTVNSITIGGGQAMDVLLDTSGYDPGTYFLYAGNMYLMSTPTEDMGGMLTEITIQ
jgi:FtsP/CotA-like multicopper oxidase with cupredoxin domain